MALQKTIVLEYGLSETGIRTRRQLLIDRSAIVVSNDFEYRELTITASQQISIAGVTTFFMLRSDSPVQLNLNNTGYMTINDLFVMTGAIPNLTIFNNLTTPIHCIVCNI